MSPSTTRRLLGPGLVLATLAVTLAAHGGTDGDGGSQRIDARTIAGTISGVAWSDAKIIVDAAEGPVTLRIDRNTAVFLENRLGSTRDLTIGTPVRASFGGDNRAVWVEVRSHPAAAAAAQDGGVAAADGGTRDGGTAAIPPALAPPAGAPATDGGPAAAGTQAAAATDGGPTAPSSVPAGPSPPEPNPGVTPTRPPPPGPTGPGPVAP